MAHNAFAQSSVMASAFILPAATLRLARTTFLSGTVCPLRAFRVASAAPLMTSSPPQAPPPPPPASSDSDSPSSPAAGDKSASAAAAAAASSSSASSSSDMLSNPLLKPLQLPEKLPVPPPLSTLGHSMPFVAKTPLRRLATSFRLFKQLRGRFPSNSILTARVSGALPDRSIPPRPFSAPELTLPALTSAIRLAAHDPRIAHLHLRIDSLACGWAKIFELRRHLDFFAASGKTVSAFLEIGGPKELFLAMGFALYVSPEAALSVRGFATSGTFVRGVLDKIGIEPQVERIGKYKSAGDQLARTDMSDAQREQLSAILDDVYRVWLDSVVEATGIDRDELVRFVDRAPMDTAEFVDAGLVAGVCYETALEDALKLRFGKRAGAFGVSVPGKSDLDVVKGKLPGVDALRYARRVTPRLLGVAGRKRIAVIRAVGAISPGRSGASPVLGTTVGSDTLVELITRVRNDDRFVGCILRCDSPGGAALASDIVWNELRRLRAVKPLVATQSDVAASGGYYLSMAGEIVSEPLTVTGSVGVLTAKPSLAELYRKIGYTKENISVGGRYAELLVDNRPFNDDETEYFRQGSQLAYDKFVNKAAQSRGKTVDEMEIVAQGRVWTGLQAKENGMVDHLGGLWRAVEVVKERAKIEKDDFVTLEEIRAPMSFSERLGIGAGMRASEAAATAAQTAAVFQQPLALAEVDGSLSGVSPVTRAVLDAALAPVITAVPALQRWPRLVEAIIEQLS